MQDVLAENQNDQAVEYQREVGEGAYEETTCKHCGMVGNVSDGEQLHWKDCPEMQGQNDMSGAEYNGDR